METKTERLSLDDHPSRRSILMGEPGVLPKRRAPVFGTSGKTGSEQTLGHEPLRYGEFIPNPPGCVGLRRVPSSMEVEMIEKMMELQRRPAGEAHPGNWEYTGAEQFIKEEDADV